MQRLWLVKSTCRTCKMLLWLVKTEARKFLNGLVKLVFSKELAYSKATNQRQSGCNNPLDPVKCADSKIC